jgi:hypothetical protein
MEAQSSTNVHFIEDESYGRQTHSDLEGAWLFD